MNYLHELKYTDTMQDIIKVKYVNNLRIPNLKHVTKLIFYFVNFDCLDILNITLLLPHVKKATWKKYHSLHSQ